ncbi:MAG: nucleoside deaminase [Pseudolabrys sp.]
MPDHTAFMRIAIEEAKLGLAQGEQPFGAALAIDGKLVSRTHSSKVVSSDSTAHGELLAVKVATQSLKTRMLKGATLYCTCEPCSMCAGAIFNAGVNTLVIGARLRDLDDSAFHVGTYSVEALAAMLDWKVTIIDGVLGSECIALYNNSTVTLSR